MNNGDIRHEPGILHTTVKTIVANQQKYKDVAKLAVPGTSKCLRNQVVW